ncbi:hypothetical protein RRJ83_002676 [Vibrio parahaemolyticus]|nr:hypothetical protein [Vibrio parahaemolyticus]
MQCNFCLNECEQLINSHIVPKFIYKWIKKTSTTGRLRDAQKIDRPVQDGLKVDFLCEDCEVDFSTVEKFFSENIFIPIANKDGDFTGIDFSDERVKKFIVSVIWRVAKYTINNPEINGNWTADEIENFDACADELKSSYYTDGKSRFSTYLVPTNSSFAQRKVIDIEDYAYFERSVSMDFMIYDDCDGRASVFIKLPFMLIVCEFVSFQDDMWTGMDVNNGLVFDAEKCSVPAYVSAYMQHDCRRHYQITAQMSQSQQEKLKKMFASKANENQGTVKAILKNRSL